MGYFIIEQELDKALEIVNKMDIQMFWLTSFTYSGRGTIIIIFQYSTTYTTTKQAIEAKIFLEENGID